MTKIVGVDLAQNSTGITAVDIRDVEVVLSGGPIEILFETHVSCANNTPARIKAARMMANICATAEPDLVVIEDYTNQAFSYVSFSTGELSGMLRLLLWDADYDQLFVPPAKVKTFLVRDGCLVSPKSKKEIAFMAERVFGYMSKLHYKREREDATDAFVLAMIGYVRLALKPTTKLLRKTKVIDSETLDGWLSDKQRTVFYGDRGLVADGFLLEGVG